MLLCVDIPKCLIRAGKQLILHHHLKCHFHSREKTLTTLYRDGIFFDRPLDGIIFDRPLFFFRWNEMKDMRGNLDF